MLFVFALETVQKPLCFSAKYGFLSKLVHSRNFFYLHGFFGKNMGSSVRCSEFSAKALTFLRISGTIEKEKILTAIFYHIRKGACLL